MADIGYGTIVIAVASSGRCGDLELLEWPEKLKLRDLDPTDDRMTTLTERETKALEAISRANKTLVGYNSQRFDVPVGDHRAIGRAAVRGEHYDIMLDIDAKRAIGREVAEALARNGHAKALAGRYVLPD